MMVRLVTRTWLEVEDYLRWNPAARSLLHRRALRKAYLGKSQDASAILRSVDQLCAAARFAPDAQAMRQTEEMILECTRRLDMSKIDWREAVPNVERRQIEKSVILKPRISATEKGVVFVSFEDQWARLLWKCNLKEFAENYTLVLSPTWSPPHSLINCLFPRAYPGPIFCLISNTKDLHIFPRLSKRYVMVPLFASSWINPLLYKPVPFREKDLDIFMIANFGKYKRHFLLFKALRDMPASVRVLLVGQENGDRSCDTILAEARAYGVEDRFELLVNAPNSTVLDSFCRAKITVILSQREGSCVAMVESMFANTPVGIFEDAEIGSRVYINESTGRFLQHRNLSRQLVDFIATAHRYSPRAWAEKSISCFCSTKRLNDTLKTHALATGQTWTQDIAVHHWRPDPQLISASERALMQPSYDEIETRFGITLGTNSRV
jgi:glycosyltransferase involved in cell wall biosynthesis